MTKSSSQITEGVFQIERRKIDQQKFCIRIAERGILNMMKIHGRRRPFQTALDSKGLE